MTGQGTENDSIQNRPTDSSASPKSDVRDVVTPKREFSSYDDFRHLELESIRSRRRALNVAPETDDDLVGLAISGGGIRSASFSLGVLQGLAPSGLFRCFDYLSTVSGGGYTGALLSSLLAPVRSAAPGENTKPSASKEASSDATDGAFPLPKDAGKTESVALQHLRNGSNYLSPGGLLHQLRVPMLLLRGIVINLLLVLPALLIAVFVTELAYELGYWPLPATQGISLAPVYRLLVLFFAGALLLPVVARLTRADRTWTWRNRVELVMAAGLGVLILLTLALPALRVTQWAIETPWHGEHGLKAMLTTLTAPNWGLHSGVVLALVVGAVALARFGPSGRGPLSRLLVIATAALGPVCLFGLYLLLCVVQVDSPFVSDSIVPSLELASARTGVGGEERPDQSKQARAAFHDISEALGLRGITFRGDLGVHRCPSEQHRYLVSDLAWLKEQTGSAGEKTIAKACTANADASRADWEQVVGTDHSVFRIDDRTEGDGSLSIEFAELAFREGPFFPSSLDEAMWWRQSATEPRAALVPDWAVVLAIVLMLGCYWAFYNVNSSSLHQFYRDRLSRLFLFRIARNGDAKVVCPRDELRLSELAGSTGPYHLVNTALNLHGSTVAERRGRTAGFFLLSPRVSGSQETGYCKTTELETRDPRLNLGTAMAISGAAASPNMGTISVGPFAFAMALLNLRLGYWLPNPRFINEGKFKGQARPGWTLLWREALSLLHERGRYVNLSDGGHVENLGAYELLRRRCRTVVVIDGEADPEFRFHGLMTLMRLSTIDLGVRISLDCGPLEPKKRLSQAHFVRGTIDYGDGHEPGLFFYIKSSITGGEYDYVRRYAEDREAFPHESTADQFFDEEQFEVYRALGQQIGTAAARDPVLVALVQRMFPGALAESSVATGVA